MVRLKHLSAHLNMAVTGFCALLLASMLGISFSGALYQAIFGEALSWTYSLARQFVPWIALLSITVAFHHGEHVAMTLITKSLPPFPRMVLQLATVAAIGVLGLVLLIAGFQFTVESDQLVMISDRLQFSQRWVAASLPVTGAIMLIHLVVGRALLEEAVAQEAAAPTGRQITAQSLELH